MRPKKWNGSPAVGVANYGSWARSGLKALFPKEGFLGKEPYSFIYVLSLVAFFLEEQNRVVATDVV